MLLELQHMSAFPTSIRMSNAGKQAVIFHRHTTYVMFYVGW